MGEGWEGVNAATKCNRKSENRLPLIALSRIRLTSGSITPTLTRPHQGGGND
jgi:hypothetical protein